MRARLLIFLLWSVARLPLRVQHALGARLGRWAAGWPQLRLTAVTRINLAHCFPDWSVAQRQQLLQHSLEETGKTALELAALWFWSPPRLRALMRGSCGEHYLQTALEQGRGVILLTPHLGAWEMAGLYASQHYPITSLYRPPRLQGIATLIKRGRERLGAKLVPTDNQGIRALFQALKRGEVVGILPDQVPGEAGTGVFAPFFAQPAYTMTLVARLAHKTGAPVIFTYAERLPNALGFQVHFLPAPEGIDAADLTRAATALNQGVMHCIQACLAQYQWSYKRFKTVPPGVYSPYESGQV